MENRRHLTNTEPASRDKTDLPKWELQRPRKSIIAKTVPIAVDVEDMLSSPGWSHTLKEIILPEINSIHRDLVLGTISGSDEYTSHVNSLKLLNRILSKIYSEGATAFPPLLKYVLTGDEDGI